MRPRLELPTLHVSPDKPLHFTFNGRQLQGLSGDRVATALWAEGVRIFSRSFKYHRPRGLYSLDGETSGCLMEIDHTPNVMADQTPLREGMTIKTQNVLGSLRYDLMSVTKVFDWAMGPGFYYRMFHKPYALWPFFMRMLRRVGGLGRLNPDWRGRKYGSLFLNSDVCVVGGGPAGLCAALSAAEEGARMLLLDLAELGIDLMAVADSRRKGQDKNWVRILKEKGIPYYQGWMACKASG